MADKDTKQHNIDMQTIILQKDIEFIKEMLKELKDFFLKTKLENENKFATKEQLKALEEKFKPTKLIAYGIAYGTMGMVLIGILSTVITKK